MSLWATPLSEIDWKAVEEFCDQRIPEGVRIDYKADFSSSKKESLTRHVAAMANTLGGMILIGVEADSKENKPQLPIRGCPNPEDASTDRVVQQCLGGIFPPIQPEVKLVRSTDGRIVVFVRVQQSVQAPHAIENSTRIYVRHESHSMPEELASLAQIEHLLRTRERPEGERRRLHEASLSALKGRGFASRVEEWTDELGRANLGSRRTSLALMACPTYPGVSLREPIEIYKWMQSQNPSVPVWPRRDGAFHFVQQATPQGSVLCYFTEGLSSGHFCDAAECEPSSEKGRGPIPLNRLLVAFCDRLEHAAAYFRFLGYLGWVSLTAHLEPTSGFRLGWPGVPLDPKGPSCVESEVELRVEVLAEQIGSAETCRLLLRQVLWSMGTPSEGIVASNVEDLLRKRKWT